MYDNSDVLDEVREILKSKESNFEEFLVTDISRENLENKDLIIVIGGDGTFIRTSHLLENELIVGINDDSSSSEGKLMSLSESNLNDLNKILDGDFDIKEVRRIDVFIDNKRKSVK